MENTTIIRKIDDLGRFVLPIDVRKRMNIMPGDTLEMSITDDSIQIKKYAAIQNVVWLAKIIIKSLFDIYDIEATIECENKILIKNNKYKDNGYKVPIILDNHQIGNFVVYNYKEEDKKIIDFVVLIFNKYLEEQG